MRNTLITLLLSAGVLVGCAPQTDCEELRKENEELRAKLEGRNRATAKQYTEKEALEKIKDYYDFYRRDYVFREPKLRRISGNEFEVSLEECPKTLLDNPFGWHGQVGFLIIAEDGDYSLEYRPN